MWPATGLSPVTCETARFYNRLETTVRVDGQTVNRRLAARIGPTKRQNPPGIPVSETSSLVTPSSSGESANHHHDRLMAEVAARIFRAMRSFALPDEDFAVFQYHHSDSNLWVRVVIMVLHTSPPLFGVPARTVRYIAKVIAVLPACSQGDRRERRGFSSPHHAPPARRIRAIAHQDRGRALVA